MSFSVPRSPEDNRQLVFARARDAAYNAVYSLWNKRKAEGMSQKDIAGSLHRDPAWVSRNLTGPGNWTLRTLAELAEAMDALVKISVVPKEDYVPGNWDIYADFADETEYEKKETADEVSSIDGGVVSIRLVLPDEAKKATGIVAHAE